MTVQEDMTSDELDTQTETFLSQEQDYYLC